MSLFNPARLSAIAREIATRQKPSPDQAEPDPEGASQSFASVVVAAIEYLPIEGKAQARAVATERMAHLARVQKPVDVWPEAVSMPGADGQNSSQVVATNVDGTSTLVIQTTT